MVSRDEHDRPYRDWLGSERQVGDVDDVKGGVGVAVHPNLAQGRDAVAVHGVGADLDALDKLGQEERVMRTHIRDEARKPKDKKEPKDKY